MRTTSLASKRFSARTRCPSASRAGWSRPTSDLKFLTRGGGLIYFLDGPADADNLAGLEKILGTNTLPIRISRRMVAAHVRSEIPDTRRRPYLLSRRACGCGQPRWPRKDSRHEHAAHPHLAPDGRGQRQI